MAKRTKRRTNSTNTGSSTELRSPMSSKPRLDPHKRQLSRFYEPLVLLYTLGRTRGEHTCAVLSTQENVSHLPLKELRRKFLSELAYACDYDKGGDTVTAIGLESTPQRYIFWVASNSCPRRKIIPFLRSLLARLKHVSDESAQLPPEGPVDIATLCIHFASPRIKKYRSHLSPLLRRCQGYLAETERKDGTFRRWAYVQQSQGC